MSDRNTQWRAVRVAVAGVIVLSACVASEQDFVADTDAPLPVDSPDEIAEPRSVADIYATLAGAGLDDAELDALLYERALGEGPLVLYAHTGGIGEVLDAWATGFASAFPGLQIIHTSPSVSDFATQVLAEHRAGRPQADVVRSSATILSELRTQGLLVQHAGLLARSDVAGWTVTPTGVITRLNPSVIAWNTDRFSNRPGPRSWDDFLLPEHAGCGLIELPSWVVGMAGQRGLEATEDWFERFLANGGQMVVGGSAQLRRLVSGEIDCLVHSSLLSVTQLQTQGAPLAWHLPAESVATVFEFSVLATTQRPHAAALFVRWAAGEEGALIAARVGDTPVHPAVPSPNPAVAPFTDPSSAEFAHILIIGQDEAERLEPQALELISRYHTPNVVRR
jgi:ABC-type Fe3+ transport system substrate-binding protein